MSPKNLSKLERVPLREAWKHEALEFTPWLAEPENLNALADALGLSELELVATEHWVGDFKLDILCTDGVEQVIIENQLAETNHKHLGQLLSYAAGVGAKKVIWLAESFRPEHRCLLPVRTGSVPPRSPLPERIDSNGGGQGCLKTKCWTFFSTQRCQGIEP